MPPTTSVASAASTTSTSSRPKHGGQPRILELQRVGQSCATPLLERVGQPSVEEGQRTAALRFGDPRVMALAGALCALVHAAVGFTNRSLCARVRSLLGGPYTSAQMTYDLRRLRLKGLIRRLPHSNTYVLTPRAPGWRSSTRSSTIASLGHCSLPTVHPRHSSSVARSRIIDASLDSYIGHARIKPAA